ncbi:hypothetical protein OY671_007780, partial [Metschnikowia pulcherrima]
MADVFICDFIRTPIGRHGGALARVRADDSAAVPIRSSIERNRSIDSVEIDEVSLGCANQAGEDNRNVARMAASLAGLPEEVPGSTSNRLCASGLEAVITGARSIRCGELQLVIAGGVESMSRAPFVQLKAETAFSRAVAMEDTTIGWRFVNPAMQTSYGVDSMPETAENVAMEYSIGRTDQDAFASRSQAKAARAGSNGRLAREIVAVSAPSKRGQAAIIDADEHPKPNTTIDDLARLRPIVRTDGTVTAGNASGVNDGAAALSSASKEAVRRYGSTPLARVVTAAAAGVPPRIMGIGPVPAIRKILARQSSTMGDIGVIESNEAFASQASACTRSLGSDDEDHRVNPNGGAIALGHPSGMSGARITGSAAIELAQGTGRYAIVSMCVGVGQGSASSSERV